MDSIPLNVAETKVQAEISNSIFLGLSCPFLHLRHQVQSSGEVIDKNLDPSCFDNFTVNHKLLN
jgi:hypothetical protein